MVPHSHKMLGPQAVGSLFYSHAGLVYQYIPNRYILVRLDQELLPPNMSRLKMMSNPHKKEFLEDESYYGHHTF